MYPDTQLYIDGQWRSAVAGKTLPVTNPATDQVIGNVAHAAQADLDLALAATERGFKLWRDTSAYQRANKYVNSVSHAGLETRSATFPPLNLL
ncbi:Putative aldehyde dehydrogenase SA1924 [Serratia plymuthica]|nr:Putative aldehyde dehydrogenase SA1924 [Serratia plymuthica]